MNQISELKNLVLQIKIKMQIQTKAKKVVS